MIEREPFFYTIHIMDNDYDEVHISKVTHNGKDISEFVTSSSAGEFAWDDKGEYGPFDSFYAVFDSKGFMRYHMDARDLTKNVQGEKVIDDGGLLLPNGEHDKKYTMMWVLPKIYICSTERTLTISNRAEFGGKPLAHSLDLDGDGIAEKEFEYLGFGVYHSNVVNGKAYSMQGVMPSVNMNVIDSGRFAESYKLSSNNSGYSMQWNWFQWSLLKYCTYIALGTLDSQSFAKGNVGGKYENNTTVKTGMSAVAENGYFAKSDDRSSERLFIENAWGNVFAWLSNTFFMDDGLYVSQVPTVQGLSKGKGMRKIVDHKYASTKTDNPGRMETGSAECWGCPVFGSKAERFGMKDYAYVYGSDYPVARVGGSWCGGSSAGVSQLNAGHGVSDINGSVGSRPVLLFDADAAAAGPVTDGLFGIEDPDDELVKILETLKQKGNKASDDRS